MIDGWHKWRIATKAEQMGLKVSFDDTNDSVTVTGKPDLVEWFVKDWAFRYLIRDVDILEEEEKNGMKTITFQLG